MERRCGHYSVTNCRCDVGLSVRCWFVSAMFPPSIFEDRCVDLQRWMIDVPIFEDRCVDLRRSMVDGRCEIMLLHLLKTLIL